MLNNETLQKIREEERRIQAAVKERLIGYVLAALGLVAALAWNDAVTSAISQIFPGANGSLLAKFIYALVLTLAITILGYYISKLISADKK